MYDTTAGHTYRLGQVAIVGHIASFLSSLPLEAIVKGLDEYEMKYAALESEGDVERACRIRDREVAATLLDAKRQVVAIYSATAASALSRARVRDSRPPAPVPLDPRSPERCAAEAARHD